MTVKSGIKAWYDAFEPRAGARFRGRLQLRRGHARAGGAAVPALPSHPPTSRRAKPMPAPTPKPDDEKK